MIPNERYITGQEMLQRADGHGGEATVDSLQDIAPDFARYLIRFPFGDICAKPGLGLRNREITTIAALTTLGSTAPQLKVYIAAGLNVGLAQEEITEVVVQMAVCTGFPAALSGLFAAEAVSAAHQ